MHCIASSATMRSFAASADTPHARLAAALAADWHRHSQCDPVTAAPLPRAVPGRLERQAVEPLLLPERVRDHVPERPPALRLLRVPRPRHHAVQQARRRAAAWRCCVRNVACLLLSVAGGSGLGHPCCKGRSSGLGDCSLHARCGNACTCSPAWQVCAASAAWVGGWRCAGCGRAGSTPGSRDSRRLTAMVA